MVKMKRRIQLLHRRRSTLDLPLSILPLGRSQRVSRRDGEVSGRKDSYYPSSLDRLSLSASLVRTSRPQSSSIEGGRYRRPKDSSCKLSFLILILSFVAVSLNFISFFRYFTLFIIYTPYTIYQCRSIFWYKHIELLINLLQMDFLDGAKLY
jgi:hypothetical protein